MELDRPRKVVMGSGKEEEENGLEPKEESSGDDGGDGSGDGDGVDGL